MSKELHCINVWVSIKDVEDLPEGFDDSYNVQNEVRQMIIRQIQADLDFWFENFDGDLYLTSEPTVG